MKNALGAALPEGAIAPRGTDTFIFCQFSAFDQLDEELRTIIAVEEREIESLSDHDVVLGHFSLPTLLRLTPASNIATVLREPRARLLSAYMYVRLSPFIESWGQYGRETFEVASRSATAFLSERHIARLTDNQFCRIVLHGDPQLQDDEFITPADAEALAEAALEQLDRLGYVGILEQDDVWDDVGRFFGVSLDPQRTNVSGESNAPDGELSGSSGDTRATVELIERRNEADRLVYESLLARRCGDRGATRRMADAAFAAQLVRFGDRMGTSAAKLWQLRRILAAS